ncbi:MAG: hypothetical protein A4E57_04324 [Syntrophorhabdaceae bacterium PtaU1.Bin034]|nr:MAG: hypothetical protein A4E57_04324 [Syntrophorhabdaceae bacterium PtaU1.Bin034]
MEREVPVTEEKPLKSKKGLYRITDEFFRFWFRFVFPHRAQLEMGEAQAVWEWISKDLPHHLASVTKPSGTIFLSLTKNDGTMVGS